MQAGAAILSGGQKAIVAVEPDGQVGPMVPWNFHRRRQHQLLLVVPSS